jgi:hypothetical protein
MRDPKIDPRPGDRFRCQNGTELEATGAVFSVTVTGGRTPCLYVNLIAGGRVVGRALSTVGLFKSGVRTAVLVERGGDDDPWEYAEERGHGEF